MIFMPYIVGIKKCDPIPACLPNTQIAGGTAAGARRFPLEQADTRVADGGGNVPTAIAGTIVDDDQFVGGKALGQNAVDRSGYMRRLVVERHDDRKAGRSEEHTSELQSLMRISYAVFCLKKKKKEGSRNN